MGRSHSNSAGKVGYPNSNGRGTNTVAESTAKKFGLTKTSGYRNPEKSVAVGGHKNDDHTTGKASDFAGPVDKMDEFAKWALESGQFTKVIWKGRNMVTGTKVAGHDDHVHVSWG